MTMSRFKFRVWDKAHKKMSFVNNLYALNNNGIIDNVQQRGKSVTQSIYTQCELMQWTGLVHEKTGVEIYEGDIFMTEEETDNGDIRHYSAVMWIPQRAAFYLVDVEHIQVLEDNDCEEEEEFAWLFRDAALYDFNIGAGLRMVGNIYENRELLNL